MRTKHLLPILLCGLFGVCQCKNVTNRVVAPPFDTSLTEIPRTHTPCSQEERPEVFLSYTGFNLSFNHVWHIPNWVAYELTQEEAMGEIKTKYPFQKDPNVKGCADPSDYKKDYNPDGYSRGHMAPAADLKWDEKARAESYYMTNICPQDRAMNSGIWNVLENKCRNKWVKKSDDGKIYIVCGPIVDQTHDSIGVKQNIAVPSAFFKVVLMKIKGKYEAIGFVMPNKKKEDGKSLADFALTVDEVEALTGYDFFHNLPDETEETAEATFNRSVWGL